MNNKINPSGEIWRGALFAGVVMALYMYFWWNKALGLSTEGWFQTYAEWVGQGLVPYRDFHLFSTPGHVLEMLAVFKWIGTGYADVRLAGCGQRILTVVVLYLWLARFNPPKLAVCAALLAGFVYSSDGPDVTIYICYSAVFWAVVAGWLMSVVLDGGGKGVLFASGLAAATAFLCKQTVGAGISLWLWVVLCLYCAGNKKRWTPLVWFVAGWLTALLPVAVWFVRTAAWLPFLKETIGGGTSSKGTLAEILYRPFSVTLLLYFYLYFAVVAAAALWLLKKRPMTEATDQKSGWPVLLTGIAAVPLGWLLGLKLYQYDMTEVFNLSLLPQLLTIAGAAAGFVLLACSLWARLKEPKDPRVHQEILLAGFSCTVWYFLAISYPLFAPMAVPGVAVAVLILGAAGGESLARRHKAGVLVLPLLWMGMLGSLAAFRYLHPFEFWGWQSPPIYAARGRSENPRLARMDLPRTTARDVDRAVGLIRANASHNGELFVFPNMPIFYSLSGIYPDGIAPLHWIDVTADYVVRHDLDRLRHRPPRVMILILLKPEEMKKLEKQYRGGRPCAQREMEAAIVEMLGDYDLVQTFETPPEQPRIEVWVRKVAPHPQVPAAGR